MENRRFNSDFQINFTPTKELIRFADKFSANWKNLSVGDYYSENKKYSIVYSEKITEKNGEEPNTNARIGHVSGVIEISKSKLIEQETNENFLFFIILWCIVQSETHNLIESDRLVMEYYKTTDRPVIDVIKGFAKLFQKALNETNLKRMKQLVDSNKNCIEKKSETLCDSCRFMSYKSNHIFEKTKVCMKKYWNDLPDKISESNPVFVCQLYEKKDEKNNS